MSKLLQYFSSLFSPAKKFREFLARSFVISSRRAKVLCLRDAPCSRLHNNGAIRIIVLNSAELTPALPALSTKLSTIVLKT